LIGAAYAAVNMNHRTKEWTKGSTTSDLRENGDFGEGEK
jgi:hypothetical protein